MDSMSPIAHIDCRHHDRQIARNSPINPGPQNMSLLEVEVNTFSMGVRKSSDGDCVEY